MQPVTSDDRKLYEDLMSKLDQGIALPSFWYTDDKIAENEIERIFRRSWQFIGSSHQLRNIGDYVTAYIGNVPVVALRNQQGIQAFVNVCRHRRHEVMKGCGNSKMMQCRYHAWTYDLDGSLKAAPRSDREPNFDLSDFPLVSVKVESLGPFVFVNLDGDAKPIESLFGKVLDRIAQSGVNLETLELYDRSEWTGDANWKTMVENYLECYHCAVAHPGFSAAIDVEQDNYELTHTDWLFSQVGNVRDSAKHTSKSVKSYDVSGEIHQAQYHLLWPNFSININPGFPNLSIDTWNPHGAGKARGTTEQYFAPGVDEKWARDLMEFNRQVGHEDDVLTNSVQRGLLGGIPDTGRFLVNSEHLVVGFQKLIVKSMICE